MFSQTVVFNQNEWENESGNVLPYLFKNPNYYITQNIQRWNGYLAQLLNNTQTYQVHLPHLFILPHTIIGAMDFSEVSINSYE